MIPWEEYDFSKLQLKPQKRPRGRRRKDEKTYMDILMAFDIETSHIHIDGVKDCDQSVMYIWQMAIDDTAIYGRTWGGFLKVCHILKGLCSGGEYIVVCVHNLSYEFQFLRGIYDFQAAEVFATHPRRILKCEMFGCLEFRCTYLHSNMNLNLYLKTMRAAHLKLSGDDFDYSKTRYPWTHLTDKEMEYCENDVLGLVEAYKEDMKRENDTLYTIPYTSTGYVRRDARKAMRGFEPHHMTYGLHIQTLLDEAFRGGNTHANRFFTGEILENVKSMDRSSSYPDVLVNCRFPMSKWQKLEGADAFDIEIKKAQDFALLMRVCFLNIRLRDDFEPVPYLSESKLRNCIGLSKQFVAEEHPLDNGRVIEAIQCETTITDIDYDIIKSMYVWDELQVDELYYSRYGNLPKPLTDLIIHYFGLKTKLKNKRVHDDGSPMTREEIEETEDLYCKSKNKLNSFYGMMVQSPIIETVLFDGHDEAEQWKLSTDKTPEQLLTEHMDKRFLDYSWGVWCTAWARQRLQIGIDKAHRTQGADSEPLAEFIYADTDSVKYLGTVDMTDFNTKARDASIKSGAWATDPNGENHYMGVYESEGNYDRFCTLGAKKYVYEQGGELHITIAGVNKRKGAVELGSIENFRQGFTFRDAGGTMSIYNDFPTIDHVMIDGKRLDITANLCIMESEYTLGITDEYEQLLKFIIDKKAYIPYNECMVDGR